MRRPGAALVLDWNLGAAKYPDRYAEPLTNGIRNAQLVIFEECSHAPIYERVEEFDSKTLAFLKQHAG